MSVAYRTDGPVAVVTIERPERRNAVDATTAAELVAAFERFSHDDALSVAVLTGASGTFCAGYDLRSVAEDPLPAFSADGNAPMGPSRMVLPKPVIAAVEGYAVAGGLELALWCDLRVVAEDATFGVFCRRFGVPLIDLGTIRLPRIVGHGVAMDLILTGRSVGAEEARAIGLASRVVPSGAALEAAVALARELAALPQGALRGDRLSAIEQWGQSTDEAVRNEFRHGMKTLMSGETLSGARRFSGGAGRHGASP